ncbi:MAG TPA: hypothetical protein ENN05_08830 [Deltaproteobacteria bacterium]|nr:hypothetical protein [Deltaproteobacteria bacterium]
MIFEKRMCYVSPVEADGSWWVPRTSNPVCCATSVAGEFDSHPLPPAVYYFIVSISLILSPHSSWNPHFGVNLVLPSLKRRTCSRTARHIKKMEIQKDFKELLELFNGYNVEYMIIGAYALAYHGVPRFTGDIDILVHPF